MSISFWRTLFSLAVHASARFPRLVPPVVVQWIDDGFYGACMREALTRTAADYRAATADTMPAPSAAWDSLCGEGPELDEDAGEEHAAMVDLHGEDPWPSSRVRQGWEA